MNRKFNYLVVCLTLLLTTALSGQETVMEGFGRISGLVADDQTGEKLVGASIALLEDPVFFIRTDLDGHFFFRDVPAGTYTIRVFKSGYEPFDVTGVVVTGGEATRIDIPLPKAAEADREEVSARSDDTSLASDIFEMAAFEVTAERIQNTEVGLLEVRQRSISIGDGIGSDFMSRAGVGDAAQAMTKIVGANVVDGKYAVIRGLGDRYSNTLLNGAALPSNDPSKKTVQLDIIPADLLEAVSTTKTFTPDKPGDFTGGSVNVETKSFPEDFILKASVSLGYNSQTTGESIAVIPDADMDFLGEVDGGLPGSIPALPPQFNSLSGAERVAVVSDMHAEPLYTERKDAPFDWGMQFSIGDSTPVFKEGKFGYVFSFTRDESYSLIPRKERNRFIGVDADSAKSGYIVDESSEEIAWGALLNLALQWNPTNEISYNYIKNQKGENAVKEGRDGFDTETENNAAAIPVSTRNLPTGRDSAVQFLSYDSQKHILRELDSHQFKGKHVFDNLNNAELKWMASFAETAESTPIDRSYTFIEFLYPDGDRDQLWIFGGNPRYPERTYGNLKDTKDNYSVDLTLPIRWEKVASLKLKAGGSLADAERVSLQRTFSYDWSLRIPGREPDTRLEFFRRLEEPIWIEGDVEGFGSGAVDIEELTTTSGNARSYFGSEEITAYYFMADLEVTDWLRFIGGARIEETDMSVEANEDFVNQALFVGGSDQGQIKEDDVLPALHTVIRLGEEGTANFRASYGRTLARPTFREFSPFRSFDTQTREIVQGNPALTRTLVDNFDARWEWFITPGEVIAVSVYHKEFENPIVATVRANGSSDLFSWTNVEGGTISGIEIEVRKTFMENFLVGGNFSYIDSEIDPVEGGLGSATVFEGQPEFIINFNLGYSNDDLGLTANLFVNYVDDTLRFVGQNVPSVFERGRVSLDANISKQFGDFTVKFSAKNLLDEASEFYYEAPGEPTYEYSKRGRDYSISVAWAF
jgi:hypothetical protein